MKAISAKPRRCKPPCPDCQTPYTCGLDDSMRIEMYDPAMPTPFELIGDACDWLFAYRWAIATIFTAGAFALGTFIAYFLH